jgi:predicted RNase H-like HicB family nuclease
MMTSEGKSGIREGIFGEIAHTYIRDLEDWGDPAQHSDSEEWVLIESTPWGRTHVTRGVLQEPTRTTDDIESRLDKLEEKVQIAIDIGLENRKLLEQLSEENDIGSRVGLGVIHSLNHGRTQLNPPIFYSYQVVDDEVVVSIEELAVYGVGATEEEAVREVQEALWSMVEGLERIPPESLGTLLKATLRTLRSRIQHNAMDA